MEKKRSSPDTEIKRLEDAVKELVSSIAPVYEPTMVILCHTNKCFKVSSYCSMTNMVSCRYQSKDLYLIGETYLHKCLRE